MTDCIFCKIIQGEIPAPKVYESNNFIAILDNHPVSPGHLLLLSKTHYQILDDADPGLLNELGGVLNELGKRLKTKLNVSGYNIGYNNGEVAGQVVPHLHFHLIPRHADDGLTLWPGQEYKAGEAEQILNLLK